MTRCAVLLVLVSVVGFLWAAQSFCADDANCGVRVTWKLKTGVTKTKTYWSHTPSREACEVRAKMHRENFSPQAVQKKTVTVQWRSES